MITISNISVNYNKKRVLRKINLDITRGDFLYIIGPSGAGKTTLLRTLYMDVIPDDGYVQVEEFSSMTIKRRKIPYLRRRLGIIFQDFKLLEERSIYDNIIFSQKAIGVPKIECKKRAVRALTNVGLFEKRDSFPGELSGGEMQRACIARALANDPILLIADEPTGNLDPATAKEIFRLLRKINKLGTAVLVATHNYKIIKQFPGKIIYLKNGRVVKEIDDYK
ncbi:MAG: ATP-binding cassette domain-containing protein [bacterium]|nr:ATP-binding cassette domain-containing protein [bacterium]